MRTSYITAGALFAGTVRNWLKRVEFNNEGFSFIETKGFLESRFDYKGPEPVMKLIEREMGKLL